MAAREVLLQPGTSPELRQVQLGAVLESMTTRRIAHEGLETFGAAMRKGEAFPVGSVEYVRIAMSAAGIEEPENISYVPALYPYLRRKVARRAAGNVLGTHFVKPVRTKAFTGFVFDTLSDPDLLDEHDREQWTAFMGLPAREEVWICEPVTFQSEWRYYVLKGDIIGSARYDPQGADDAPTPNMRVVGEAVDAMGQYQPHGQPLAAYALDFGVLQAGETALVEANDAWALGLYGRAVDARQYLKLLATRWDQIRLASA